MAGERIGELVVDGVGIPIELDAPSGRLEIHVGDQMAFIALRVRGSVLSLIHTEVPPALRGRGLAEALARAALVGSAGSTIGSISGVPC